jgi:hypothetical protein
VEMGIFVPETLLEATDSDLRLQYTLRILPLHCHCLLIAPLTRQERQFLGNPVFGPLLENPES